MSQNLNEQPIAEPITELMNIFKKSLSTVTFPDVSCEILEAQAQVVMSKSDELKEIIEKERLAREALEESQTILLQKAQRALAYAKVFAEGNTELIEQLDTINFGKPSKPSKKTSADKECDSVLIAKTVKSEEKKSAKAVKKNVEDVVTE